ncbi:MAG: nucleotidyltransferase family protein [Lachnospiraceae bacterium]|nr:nucleotidyltransferase family protein [Lachnospiraceae bacterium]
MPKKSLRKSPASIVKTAMEPTISRMEVTVKIIGIIAEYNPFHKGHAYQIETLRKKIDADYIIIAMSGNFVQRGAPALIDKYSRTRMALTCGADLVLELPVLYAAASAEYFARGGVSLLQRTGIVSHLGFGTETENLELLQETARTLLQETDNFQETLRRHLKAGTSFPAARSLALKNVLFPREAVSEPENLLARETAVSKSELEDVLSSPNNILAIEYLKALVQEHSYIVPLPLLRRGQGYHDISLETESSGENFISASAIRSLLQEKTPADNGDIFSKLSCHMPKEAYDILKNYPHPFLWENDFSMLLHHRLLTESRECLASYADSAPSLASRMKKEADSFLSWSGFCKQIKSKDITYTRLSRLFLHILLGIFKEDYSQFPEPSYLRVLGFRKSSSPLLTFLKTHSSLPIITSPSDAERALSASAKHMLSYDLKSTDLYRTGLAAKGDNSLKNDYRQQIVQL